jgi:hypothetical protein
MAVRNSGRRQPAPLPGGDDPRKNGAAPSEGRSSATRRTAVRLVEHPGPQEGHAEVAVLLDLGIERAPDDGRRGGTDPVGEPGGEDAARAWQTRTR